MAGGDNPAPDEVGSTEEAVTTACTISISSPQTATGSTWGNIVHVDANASCPSGTPEIQYFTRVNNGQWQIAKAYSTAIALDYDTHNAQWAGTLQFYAAVRKQGASEAPASSATISIALADNVGTCTSVKLTAPANGATVQAGTNVTLTAVGNCPATAEYQYWVKPAAATTYTFLPSSSTFTPGSFTWQPPNQPGSWTLAVVARVVGAHSAYQVRSAGIGITVTAAAVNQPPVVNNVAMTVAENSTNNPGTGSATDPENDPLTVTAVGTPSHGTAATTGGMGFTYTPTALYAGSDSFSYTVDDGHGHAVNGTVNVTVTTQNPVPGTHNLTTPKNTAVNANLVAGDTDPDGDPISITAVGTPTHGTAALQLDGTVTYTPATGYVGGDDFTYTESDGHGGTATGSVHVDVQNRAPVAVNDGPISVRGNTATMIDVLANDTDPDLDPLTVVSVQSPTTAGGTVLNGGANVTYTPPSGYLGSDSFTYTISDGLATSTATVTITVAEPPITCGAGAVSLVSNSSAVFNAITTAGCTDSDGDTLSVTGVSPTTAHGTLTVGADGSATYTPATNYVGSDSFTINLSDAHAQTASATISISVTDQNPIAATDSVTTNSNQAASLNLLVNDSDPDGGTLSVTGNTQPLHGTAVVNADGTGTYTPSTGYVGSDTFTYTISDGQGGSATGTVNVTVNALSPGCTITISSQETSGVYGTPLHLSANAACNTGAAEVRWWVAQPMGAFKMVTSTFSTANTTLTYTTQGVGTFQFYAEVRTVGTTTPVVKSSTLAVPVADTVPSCTSVRVTAPTGGSTFTGGTVVTLAASAVCPSGTTPEYQFWVKKSTDTTFTILPGYTTTTGSWTVPTGQPGTWGIVAVARAVGAHVSYQVRANSVNVTVN